MSLIHQNQLNNIASLITALQQHASTKIDMGLYDVGASIEVLVSQILQITEGLTLVNKNQISVTFPAIDLADDAKGIAIQVTANVSTKKWKETVEKFHKHKLNTRYKSLRIIGFCDSVKPRDCPTDVLVQGPEAILGPLKTLTPEKLVELEEKLRSSYDFSKLSPLTDRDCFGIVLGVLDRDAIRHYTSVEGSFNDLAGALKEIREVITTGQIRGKAIFAKPVSHYSAPYDQALQSIDFALGSMLAQLNMARSGNNYYLTEDQKKKIDADRAQIISVANSLCETVNISRRIRGIW